MAAKLQPGIQTGSLFFGKLYNQITHKAAQLKQHAKAGRIHGLSKWKEGELHLGWQQLTAVALAVVPLGGEPQKPRPATADHCPLDLSHTGHGMEEVKEAIMTAS